MQLKLSYGDTVDTNYYNPSVGMKIGIIVTKVVSSVYYFDENIVDKVELLTRPKVVGKNPLPLCRNCFDMNIKCPNTRGRGNYYSSREKNKHSKKRQVKTLVAKES